MEKPATRTQGDDGPVMEHYLEEGQEMTESMRGVVGASTNRAIRSPDQRPQGLLRDCCYSATEPSTAPEDDDSMEHEHFIEFLVRYILMATVFLIETLPLYQMLTMAFLVFHVPLAFLLPVMMVGYLCGIRDSTSHSYLVALIVMHVLCLVRVVYLYITVSNVGVSIFAASGLLIQLWRLYNKCKSELYERFAIWRENRARRPD